jgi:hypothetical protein
MESGEQRDQLLKMAETWEVLSRERERTLRNRANTDDTDASLSVAGENGERN